MLRVVLALWGLLLGAVTGARHWPTPPADTLVFDYARFGEWDIFVYDIQRGLFAPYQNAPDRREVGAVWSPDGEQMLYVDFGPLHTLFLRGRAAPVTPRGFGETTYFFWGPDNRTVYYLNNTGAVQVVDTATGARDNVQLPDVTYIRNTEFFPVGDAALVLASRTDDPFPQPYLLDLDALTLRPARNRELYCAQGTPQAVVPSPDGSQFVVSCRFASNLYLVDAATATSRVLVAEVDLPGGVRTAPRWSPDGTRVLFHYLPVGATDPAYVIVDVATGALTPTLGDLVPGRVEWMPGEAWDGR